VQTSGMTHGTRKRARNNPRPADFPEQPAGAADGEALIQRLESAPATCGAALDAAGADAAVKVLHAALFWDSWLGFALTRLATGERLKLGGNVIVRVPEDTSPRGLLAALATLRAEHVAELRRRGTGLWEQRAMGTDGQPITAFRLLSAIAANDGERIALLREER